MVETIVGSAVEYGCTTEQTVDMYRSVCSYTIGEILVRAHSARRRANDERPGAVIDRQGWSECGAQHCAKRS
jgi:hypothetical protein